MIRLKNKDKKAFYILKKYFPISFLLFFLSTLMGILFVKIYPSYALLSLEKMIDSFGFLFNMDVFQLGIFIFLNNLLKIFLFIFLGIFFAIPTIFFLFVNGITIGYIATIVYPDFGFIGLIFSLFLHGIFEVSALLIGSSMGIWLGVEMYRKYKEKKVSAFNDFSVMKEEISISFYIFKVVIFPLILIAAIIETLIIFYL